MKIKEIIIIGILTVVLIYALYKLISGITRSSSEIGSPIYYARSKYHKQTKNSYIKLIFNSGVRGEYLLYKELDDYEPEKKKYIFNAYIPTSDGRTSEIDLMMFYRNHIFVFENKNLSGEICGKVNDKKWSVITRSRKYDLYNPIWQNNGHIKALKGLVGDYYFDSMISFRDFTKITVYDENGEPFGCSVIKNCNIVDYRNVIQATVNIAAYKPPRITDKEMEDIYGKLKIYEDVETKVKLKHRKEEGF